MTLWTNDRGGSADYPEGYDPNDHSYVGLAKPMTWRHDSFPEQVIRERANTHGPYNKTAVAIQRLKEVMRSLTNWPGMEPEAKETAEAIMIKLGRIGEGNWREIDHWRDLSGYSELMVQWIKANPPRGVESGHE